MTVRILNIAVLLAAIVLAAVLVKKFFFQPADNPNYAIAPNAKLSINGVNWADLRERADYAINHRPGAKNIPLDELPVRAQNELPVDQTIVIYGADPSDTDVAYSILDTQGFAHVLILIPNGTPANKQSP